ncbi:zinc finger protein 91 [Eupeodes corollae]|uniref:zinc finger protein 91 n=1 Tax=Eupeodes corollae TaxID=290404 RepID=UPI002490B5D1|nr:zinc finger protein 91 [Eupeodes corollae]XP_055907749.1 zinc finger protein 91 [Eupeodes corollae]
MENLMEYRMLPAISTFPQFNRPMSILSPLDLSLRSSSIPITPPSTPSPPRKRTKMFEEQNIWRPHSLSYFDGTPFVGQHRVAENPITSINRTTSSSSPSKQPEDDNDCCFKDKSRTASSNVEGGGESEVDGQSINISEDETIILTEDDENDVDADAASDSDNDDEEYVDVLGNDDEEYSAPPKQLFLPNSDEENINPPKALTRDKLVYEDEELHKKAMDGFAKLFVRDFKNDPNPATQTAPKISEELASTSASVVPEFTKSSKMEKKRFKMRKQLSLDEDNTSPVSGTIIRKLRDDEELVVRKGDIDPAFNVVEITEEAKAILASIDNKIGAYLCQLCRTLYDDAFQLAQHRCPRIVHIEYKCSECEKVFNCPANLASHRRWHKPKTEAMGSSHQYRKRISVEGETVKRTDGEESTSEGIFNCNQCGKSFRRQAYLKKHLASHQMLEELKAIDSYKQTNNAFPHSASNFTFHQVNHQVHHHQTSQNHHFLHHPPKTYSNHPPGARFPNLFTNFDHRRFHVLSDLYLSHQLDRSSAFQYVQNQNIRGLPMAPMISPLMQMPVK